MAGALAINGVVSALKAAVCGSRQAQRAAALGSGAVAGSRRVLLKPAGIGLLANRMGAMRGAAVVCSASEDVVEVELKVDGMVCDGCSSRVAEALQKLPGVKKVNVDLEKGIATVQVEAASQLDAFNAMPQMVDTVTGLGFEAAPHFASGEEA